MRPPPLLPDGADAELTRLLQEADNKAGYRRGFCLWLRAALGLSAAGVGPSANTVHLVNISAVFCF